MPTNEPFLSSITTPAPRHAHQEVADLLGTALCRLLTRNAGLLAGAHSRQVEQVRLGFTGTQSVYGNSSQTEGV